MNSEQLGRVLQLLEEQCPTSLEKGGDADELEINIDAVDAVTFQEVDRYVKDCLVSAESCRILATVRG